eukprot:CAMPEP_0119115368 /NCGR_PEP_ID=MMETSP1180-20130426/50735_1 /TAXON_ID=3052 ORGANISM="Chlamydomonas cf sp, Strain CCMP681" /NCGR_SAMPLE_ID=MMETSP1180 /ASSEMBLY_ACC=CAM_ASM_000741 /LENGTH=183 /DNA_ID=CAMNT_0007104309 /DNA_START=949 /DNA_END=1502 /DNA_ORIENTATION=+
MERGYWKREEGGAAGGGCGGWDGVQTSVHAADVSTQHLYYKLDELFPSVNEDCPALCRASQQASSCACAPAAMTTAPTRNGSCSASAATQDGARAVSSASQKGTYGLMSSTGDPSTTSAPPRISFRPLTEITCATLSPTGTGRCGLRVASTPTFAPFSLGTEILAFSPAPLLLLRLLARSVFS